MNLVQPSPRFFFSGGPKNVFSLSLDVKRDQQTANPSKNDISNYGINLQKTILKSPITILPMLFAGELSHNIGVFFLLGLRGFLWVGLWEVEKLWVRFMGVTLVYRDFYILSVR
jgi:hypothetical protein